MSAPTNTEESLYDNEEYQKDLQELRRIQVLLTKILQQLER